MKKDIEQRPVEDVAIAIVPGVAPGDELWDCYLINLRPESLRSVLVSSRGYGERDGEPVTTTALRYFYEEIGGEYAARIEPIQRSLFELTNEFWVSFRLADGYTYDKKYVFVRGSIREELFTAVPLVGKRGVLHR